METAPHFYPANLSAWRQWLQDHHQSENCVWLVFDKGSQRTMSWQDIVEEALCFGWIDSRPGKVSDAQSKIYISRRKPQSVWSKINKHHVERLIAQGLIQPAGLQAIEIAKHNGSWEALELSDSMVYPPELDRLFAHDNRAKENFENFPTGSRRNTLQWIYDAKTDSTRQNRITQTFEAAKANKRLR